MDRLMSTLNFELMSLMFKVRDFLRPRSEVLKEIGIEPGLHVLDFGCGPGGYIAPLAQLVGPGGKIYAVDVHSAAIAEVKRIAARKNIENLETIASDCRTGLPDNSIDLVLLYDVFHELARPDEVLCELSRVLKPEGILSFSDHHMQDAEILAKVSGAGLFNFSTKGKYTYKFRRIALLSGGCP